MLILKEIHEKVRKYVCIIINVFNTNVVMSVKVQRITVMESSNNGISRRPR